MLFTYATLAARRMRRHAGYTVLNVSGLAIGLAGCLLIACFIGTERSVDRFHASADQIVRVVQEGEDGGSAWTGGGHAALLSEVASGVEQTARVAPWERRITVPESATSERAVFAETGFFYVDPSFFDVFSFGLAAGDQETALASPGTAVLSKETARRYFGDADPMGQVILMYDGYSEPDQLPLTVTGILADPPGRSHLDVDVLTAAATLEGQYGPLTQFDWPGLYTYARLAEGADPEAIAASATSALAERAEEEAAPLRLQPLTDIYLNPLPEGEPGAMGSITLVYGLSALALIVLLLACINFANLAVARMTAQVRASGVRRSVGAQRYQLVVESLVDTYVQIGVAVVLALGIVAVALPWASQVAGQDLASVVGFESVALLVGMVLLTGLIAGGYPAFLVSRQQPALSLRGVMRRPRGTARLRSGLVIVQFGCAVALLVGSLVVQSQVDYMRDLQLGFDREQVVVVEAGAARRSYEPLRDALTAMPGVEAVTASMGVPGLEDVQMPSVARREGQETGGLPIHDQGVGPDFFETMGIRFIAGRAPEPHEEPESIPFQTPDRLLVVNETAVSELGWAPDEALGQRMRVVEPGNEDNSPGLTGTVVGVVADFHHGSARDPIPASVYYSAQSTDVAGLIVISHVLVKLAPGVSAGAFDDLRSTWQRVLPDQPFEATFLNDQIRAQYEGDLQLGQSVGVFAALAVLVACLGLFGLASLVAEQRTQEIGVRKSLGATSGQIAALLSGSFLRLVVFAFVASVPIAYVLAHRWLDAFAYRIDLGLSLFLFAGGIVSLVALAAVSIQTVRAARTNPVDALRYE